jgi:hypothetical protein
MKVEGWLTVNDRGTNMLLTKTQPGIDHDEVSIRIQLNLPDELFERPRLSAEITIPKEATMPTEITADVVEDCKEAIKQVTGLEMKISVIKDEDDVK